MGTHHATSVNPVYEGFAAQDLMREHGYTKPVAPPAPTMAPVVADAAPMVHGGGAYGAVDQPIAAAMDDAAARMAALEGRLIDGFQRLGALPADQQLPTLLAAVDGTAAAGHGDDAIGVLAEALTRRPLDQSVASLDEAIEHAVRAAAATPVAPVAAPLADEVAKVATPLADEAVKVGTPLADEVAKVVGATAPDLLAAVMHPASTGASALAIAGSDDVLRYGVKGAMSMSAGIDETLRLLVRLR